MIDHILGKPSPTYRRLQVFLVILFWSWRLYLGDVRRRSRLKMRLLGERQIWGTDWVKRQYGFLGLTAMINRKLKRFSPYQLVLGTFTIMYALRNLDVLVGLGAPEPLARMYSRAYYRATYMATAFDAGFATAMPIRPQWLKDFCSFIFSIYYLFRANQADEKLRRYRSVCTVEMLRTTWEKTSNPYIRMITFLDRPSIPLVRKILLPRPKNSKHTKPISGMLFFDKSKKELESCTELILDFPGGGFVAMGPEHHEERLRAWAKRTGKPILAIDYGKAPEYPYPWAIEEGFDVYRTLVNTKGSVIGIHSGQLDIIMSGDSAGGNICTTIMLNILESPDKIQHPLALVLAYPALDFNFNSWMTPQDIRVLRTEQSSRNIPGIAESKDHLSHKSPLAVVNDDDRHQHQQQASSVRFDHDLSRQSSWHRFLRGRTRPSTKNMATNGSAASTTDVRREQDKTLRERNKTPMEEMSVEALQKELRQVAAEVKKQEETHKPPPTETRMTMTSRTGYFQDRIIDPSMMRAMAILYIGPVNNPDFATDYYISPILSPEKLLAQFPRTYFICGEKDPFVDDTVITAGKLRQAKRNKRQEARRDESQRMATVQAGLRMSRASGDAQRDPILDQDDDDWLTMRIIEGWGHGFMQMVSVMKHEVEPVLTDIADWIDETFAQAADERKAAGARANAPSTSSTRTPTSRPPGGYNLVKAAEYTDTDPGKTLGSADLGAPLAADELDDGDDDDDDVLSFSTKKTRRASSSTTAGTAAESERPAPPPRRRVLPRSDSIPHFDDATILMESSSSTSPETSTAGAATAPRQPAQPPVKTPRGSYAFFTQRKAEAPRVIRSGAGDPMMILPKPSPPQSRSSETQPPQATLSARPRTASPANLDHAKGGLSEAELLRRRRVEAVYGMMDPKQEDHKSVVGGGSGSGANGEKLSENGRVMDDDDEPEEPGFRWA